MEIWRGRLNVGGMHIAQHKQTCVLQTTAISI